MPLGDINLDALFGALPPEAVLDAITAMLCEQQVLLVSSNMLLIGQAVEGLTALLYPLIWSHLLIPLLPAKLVDVLQAPVPFICGAHSSTVDNLPPVRAADGSIVSFIPDTITYIDLDEGTVRIPGSGKEMGEVLKEMGKELKDALGSFGKSMGSWTKTAILGQHAMSPGSPRHEDRSAMAGGELDNPDVVWTPLPAPVRAELLDSINTFAVRPLMQHKLFGAGSSENGAAGSNVVAGGMASTAVAAAAAAGRLGEGMGLATVAAGEEGVGAAAATAAPSEGALAGAETDNLSGGGARSMGESMGESTGEPAELVSVHRGGLVRVGRLRACFVDAIVSMLHTYTEFGVAAEEGKEEVKEELTLLSNGRMGVGTGGKGAKELQGFDDKYDRSSFIKTCSSSHQEFISNFVGTQMFVCLVEMRLMSPWEDRHPDDVFDCKCAEIKAKQIAAEEEKRKKAEEREQEQEEERKRAEGRRASRGYSTASIADDSVVESVQAVSSGEAKEIPLTGQVRATDTLLVGVIVHRHHTTARCTIRIHC
jgi:hypothetical protein